MLTEQQESILEGVYREKTGFIRNAVFLKVRVGTNSCRKRDKVNIQLQDILDKLQSLGGEGIIFVK